MSEERTNAQRGDDAWIALQAHASAHGRHEATPVARGQVTRAHRVEPVQDRLSDLITDLRHLADGHGVDWDYVMRIVDLNYRAERDEQVPSPAIVHEDWPQQDRDPSH